MQFELKCVSSVCVHNYPIMIKIQQCIFFSITMNHYPFLKSSRSQILSCVTLHRPRPRPRLLINPGVLSQNCPEWAVNHWADVDKNVSFEVFMICVPLLDVIMNTAVVIYTRHLSRWRRSGLLLFLKGMCPQIYLHAFMLAQIIHDPA